MFIVFLRFSANKSSAPEFMDGHNQWLKQGFDDGVFLIAGSLQPGLGGAIIARDTDRAAIESRVANDPFVVENVVSAEIMEMSPAKTDPRLDFLLS